MNKKNKKINRKAQLVGGETALWIFRVVVLIGLVVLGTIFIVARYNSVKLDKKPLLASQIIDAVLNCMPSLECVNIGEEYYVKIYRVDNDKEKFEKGNNALEEFCKLKKKGVKLEFDVYCSYFKAIKDGIVYSGLVVVK